MSQWTHLVCQCGEYFLPIDLALRVIDRDHLAHGHRIRVCVTASHDDVVAHLRGGRQ